MKYEHVYVWTKCFDLVSNRIKMLNHMLGGSYDGCMSNPVRLVMKRGRYSVMLWDDELATFRVYDLDSTQHAFERLDFATDVIWQIRRRGFSTESQPKMANV